MIPGRKFSNQVHFLERGDFYQIFIPAYLRMTFKKISQINIQQSNASMIATVILTLYYKGISQVVKQNLLNKMILTMGQQHVLLSQNENKTKISDLTSHHTLTFTYRDVFKLQMSGSVFTVPFDVQNLSIKAYLRTLQCTQRINGKKVLVRFNLMDHSNNIIKFSVNKVDDMGQFGLVGSMMKASYGNQLSTKQITKLTKQDKINKPYPFHMAVFETGIYRFPANTLLMIFIPLWLLALINLAVFFQNHEIKNRIANIATLLVAYSAFLPTVRSKIPPSPNITLIQILTYTLLSTLVFSLIQSLVIYSKQSQFIFIWKKSFFFLLCLGITIFSFILISILLIYHKLWWQPSYVKLPSSGLIPFKSQEWQNAECDMYFADMRPNLRPISQLISH